MENTDKIAPALVRVQAEIKVAKKGKENPFFKSKYADLGAVWEACHEALTKNGIAVIQPTAFRDGVHLLQTILLHESGQSILGEYHLRPVKDDPQGMGSAVTYARRYALAAMIGIIQEDDDGRIASTTRGTKADTSKLAAKLTAKDGRAEVITPAQAKELVAAWRAAGHEDQAVAAYLVEKYGINTTKEIKRSDLPSMMEWAKKKA